MMSHFWEVFGKLQCVVYGFLALFTLFCFAFIVYTNTRLFYCQLIAGYNKIASISGTPDISNLSYSVDDKLVARFKSDSRTSGKGFKVHYTKGKIIKY